MHKCIMHKAAAITVALDSLVSAGSIIGTEERVFASFVSCTHHHRVLIQKFSIVRMCSSKHFHFAVTFLAVSFIGDRLLLLLNSSFTRMQLASVLAWPVVLAFFCRALTVHVYHSMICQDLLTV